MRRKESITFVRDPLAPFFEVKHCDSGLHARREHFHREYALGFVEQGKSCSMVEGESLEIGADSLVLFAPFAIHNCMPTDMRRWRFRMVFVEPALAEHGAFPGAEGIACVVRSIRGRDGERVRVAFDVMESRSKGLEEKRQAFGELLALAASSAKDARTVSLRMRSADASTEYLYERLLANCDEKLPLRFLAEQGGGSPWGVLRRFKRRCGLTPHAMQMLLRVNRAKELLRAGFPIADVALQAGFYDQSHFSRVFRETCGVSPRAYRTAGVNTRKGGAIFS